MRLYLCFVKASKLFYLDDIKKIEKMREKKEKKNVNTSWKKYVRIVNINIVVEETNN